MRLRDLHTLSNLPLREPCHEELLDDFFPHGQTIALAVFVFNSTRLFSICYSSGDNSTMDIAEIRRRNLRAWIDNDPASKGNVEAWCAYYSQFAEKPLTPSYVRQLVLERGKAVRNIGERVARKLEAIGRHPPGWLDFDHSSSAAAPSAPAQYELPPDYPASPALAGSPEATAETLPIPSDDDYALIPQYSARAACGPAYHNGHVEVRGGLAFKRDWLARMGLRPENLSVIAANGESMAPTIHDGEVLLIDHSDTEPRDGKVFALARGDEMVVKRLARDFAGGWIVRSDNSDKARFGNFHVSDAAIRIVGRVVWRGGGL